MSKQPVREYTDPSVYQTHHDRFTKEGLPTSTTAWLRRATEVAAIFTTDAPARDIANKSPRAEISLLKSAGLLKILGPAKYGGGAQTWETAYKAIRIVARGDGSLGQLLAYHLLWSTTANVVGTDQQKDGIQKVIIESNYFVGGAVNPRDSDLSITQDPNDEHSLIFNGSKNFSTGGVISDLTVLEGVYADTGKHIFTFVKTDQPGIQFKHNWDNVGLRLSESGGVKIDHVVVPWTDALGWDPVSKEPIKEVLEIPFATLLLPTIQAVFSNFYLGIAQGALAAAREFTANLTRAWPYGGDNKDSATEEFYILEKYGTWHAQLLALEGLADRAGAEIAGIYADAERANGDEESSTIHFDATPSVPIEFTVTKKATNGSNGTNGINGNGHSQGGPAAGRSVITARHRGDAAEVVASFKIVATDTGLAVASGIFEVLGARATVKAAGFDRFWRDIRTHSLHDPVAYKRREVGRYALLGEVPEPTWYT